MLVQCWPTVCDAGLALNQHAGLVMLTAGGEYKPTLTKMSVKCWSSVADAGQYPFMISWVNVGPPSVTLVHIQRGAKHDTVTQYWTNVGSAS